MKDEYSFCAGYKLIICKLLSNMKGETLDSF